MDISKLDKDLVALIEKKIELSKLDYSSEHYDDLEEELHDLEDDFLENYGDYLEDALHEVHDEFCPDSDVLLPIAYLPKEIKKTADGYDIDFKQGVYVEVDDYAGKETKLVLLPKPTRIILQIDANSRDIVWTAK
ncbi:hypothetical protein LVD15_16315 [Fulvivirga maritima]|uniref:hypothetical protein n=1 Tax=Fulvivirga maritima TaxID=2904247 RepID=UPI001F3AF0FE|nr:hypothetical protein [Fulvivirga maritima]UII24864.1 hypothetical protein LVD15_16315 [Fulvivirga maritima]